MVALLYACSGSLGLVYEVAFNKYLAYIFGATAYASSAVLVAFMGGLALGAFVASKIDRFVVRPLLVYGIVEIAIGAFCMLVPLSFDALGAYYVKTAAAHPGSLVLLTVIRAALAVAVVVVPAGGMGATLPLLARFVQESDRERARRRLARLYAVNTLGGALGSLGAAYVIVPMLGLTQAMRAAAATSISVGLAAMALSVSASGERRIAVEVQAEPAKSDVPSLSQLPIRDAILMSFASGLLVFSCEVVMVHLLALVIGTSVYAFGLMLAIFLVSLSVGTPVATRLGTRFGAGAVHVGFTAAGIALLLSLFVWDKLPLLFTTLGPVVRSWGAREATRGVAAFVALFVPVVAMGTTFPLVLRAARASQVGGDVGRLTVANTIGSILGSIVAGFWLLPHLGSQRSLVAIALIYLSFPIFAARHAFKRSVSPVQGRVVAFALGGVVLAIVSPRWNLARLTSGANVYFDSGVVPDGVLERVHEDIHGGVTTVVRAPDGTRTLLTNGKFQGNDGQEIGDNRAFSHLPVIFAKNRAHAMVIGLGTGTSAGTMAAYDFQGIDIAELSPAIVEASRTTFAKINHDVMKNPRVHLHLDDGRNVLLVGKDQYDVISIEVSSIWFAGAANLYNREFYTLVDQHLAEGGVLQQWFQLHHTNRRIVSETVATLRSVFPCVYIAITGHQGQLLASRKPFRVYRDALFDLEKIGYVKETLGSTHLVDLVKSVVLDENGVDDFLKSAREDLDLDENALLSTDDNLFLEYATPKMNVPSADDIADTVSHLGKYRLRATLPTLLLP